MAQAPVMPVWTDALIGDTTHLSTEQFGAYVLILIATWRNNGKPLPDDDERMAHVSRVSVKKWRQKLRPVVGEFFRVDETGWHQLRLEKEWARVEQKLKQRRSAGRKGGLSKQQTNGKLPISISIPDSNESGPPDPPRGGRAAPRKNVAQRRRQERQETIARGLANWARKHDIDCLAA